MKELSLHVLDIASNSTAAGASKVLIEIASREEDGLLWITVEDNGRGMTPEHLKKAADPFFTTKPGKKAGMGISLFKMAAELTGGSFLIESAPHEGTAVCAAFQNSHIDCPPLGNMAETMAALVHGSPNVGFHYRHVTNSGAFEFDTEKITEALPGASLYEPRTLLWISQYISKNDLPG